MSVLRRLMGDTVVYTITPLLSTFVGVFLIPVYTRNFTPTDYGALAQINATTGLAVLFVIFGLDNSSAVWFWEHPEPAERSRTFSTWLAFSTVVSTVLGLGAVLARTWLAGVVFDDVTLGSLWVLFAANLVTSHVSRIGSLWFRLQRAPWPVVLMSGLTSLVTAGSGVLLVVVVRVGLNGAVGAQAIGSVVGALVTLLLLRKVFSVRAVDLARLKPMLKMSAPLVLMVNLNWLRSTSVTYFVNFLCSRGDAGLYQLANSLASVLGLVMFAFDQAWAPFALSLRDEAEAKRIYGVAVEASFVVGLFFACAIGAFARPALGVIADPRYVSADWTLVILAFNTVIVNVPTVLSVTFAREKKTMPLAKATAIGAAVTVVSLPFVAKMFGKEGAAAAVTAGSIAVLYFAFQSSQRVFRIAVSASRVGGAFLVVVGWLAVLVLSSTSHHRLAWVLVERTLLLLGLVAALVLIYRAPVKEAWLASRASRA